MKKILIYSKMSLGRRTVMRHQSVLRQAERDHDGIMTDHVDSEFHGSVSFLTGAWYDWYKTAPCYNCPVVVIYLACP